MGSIHQKRKPCQRQGFSFLVEPAQWYSNSGDLRAAGLYRSKNCSIKQKSPGTCRGSRLFHIHAGRSDRAAGSADADDQERSGSDQRHHATPRIFSTLFRMSSGSRPEPFTLPAISSASTSAGSGSGGFDATPRMVQ